MSNIPELPTLNSKPLNASHQYIEVKINLIKQKAWTIKISIKIHIISIPYETFLEQHIFKMYLISTIKIIAESSPISIRPCLCFSRLPLLRLFTDFTNISIPIISYKVRPVK